MPFSLFYLTCPFLQVRPETQRGGVLFAITDAPQKVVKLGLALTPVRGGLQSILLYYTDTEGASHSRKAASFSVPDMTDQWTRFTVSVTYCRNKEMLLPEKNLAIFWAILNIK